MSEKKKSAFTLIEMIIVISLILIVIGITSSIFITGNRVFSDSDVNTTLQMEAQRIQEKISDIAMQANYIESVDGDDSTGIISDITINSYDKSGNSVDFKIQDDGGKLTIDGIEITGHLKEIKINKDIITGKDNDKELKQCKAIKFEITLAQSRGFSQNVEYPINFMVTLRNN